MADYRVGHESEPGGEVTIRLSGRIALDTLAGVSSDLDELVQSLAPSRLTLDLSGVDFMDSAGALAIFEVERRAEERSVPVERVNPSAAVRGMTRLLSRAALEAEPHKEPPRRSGMLHAVGAAAEDVYHDFLGTMTFLGELLLSGLSLVRRPRRLRIGDLVEQIGRVGLDGLFLVGTIGFMLGFVVALMALTQLRKYGVVTMLPTVVTKALVSQFGPLITAILVAGRSGSAFAAEIASMKINDEVDALRVMGFSPVRYLALPRVAATIVAVPLLSVYGNLLGIFGGFIVGVAEGGMSPVTFIQGIPLGLTMNDALESLIKSAVFGALVAGVGCQRGFRARRSPEEVGTSTTSAVVSSIFLIILTDAVAALVISKLGL